MPTPRSNQAAPLKRTAACLLILACAAFSHSIFAADAPNHFNEARAQALLVAGQAALEEGDLSLAQTTLDQAIQLLKINEGLYSTEQLVPIEQLMWAQMRAGLWPQLDTSLGYYYWLLERIETTTLDAQLAIAKNMRSLYLEAAAHPSNPMPPRHLSAALRTNWQTLSYIEATLGAEHPALRYMISFQDSATQISTATAGARWHDSMKCEIAGCLSLSVWICGLSSPRALYCSLLVLCYLVSL